MHLISHSKMKLTQVTQQYECSHCEKTFSKRGLRNHLRTQADEEIPQCIHCCKIFSHKCLLKIHMRTHDVEKLNQCSHCDKTFAHECKLMKHLLTHTHTREKPCPCKQCIKVLSQYCNVKDNQRIHIREEDPTSHINFHMRTHDVEKVNQCSHCDKTFSHESNLLKHLLTHGYSMDKPCQCNQCIKLLPHIKDNQRILTREKDPSSHIFVCHVCYKTIMTKEDLDIHLNKHENNSLSKYVKGNKKMNEMDSSFDLSSEKETANEIKTEQTDISVSEDHIEIELDKDLDYGILAPISSFKTHENNSLSNSAKNKKIHMIDSNLDHISGNEISKEIKTEQNDILVSEDHIAIDLDKDLDDAILGTISSIKKEELNDLEVKDEDLLDTMHSMKQELDDSGA
ncbi:unnamed protein product [Meganyctiphanes norvegica]|uniref:C2H2-type domain-containing protein n=1 Tax=Meganyctiphanes norvegica TaxID=48144 RepID=A0AAV2PLM3_MEGNR